jgi:glycosyltransferase involved in cell wall biosynthesis
MQILVLSPYAPFPPRSGGALRIYHLLRALAAQHQVTLLTVAAADELPGLAPLRAWLTLETVPPPPPRNLLSRALSTVFDPLPDMALRNADSAFAAALDRLLRERTFDAVQAESIEMAGYLAQARRAGLPTVLDEFNAEALLQRRTAVQDLRTPWAGRGRALIGGVYSLVQAAKLAHYERQVVAACDRVLVVSHEDAAELRRLSPQAQLQVVYNGVDTAHVVPRDAQPVGATIIFVASLDYRPNVDALQWFVSAVLPRIAAERPDVQLRIVGRRPTAAVRALHDGRRVIVVGEVADMREELAAAAVSVIPMRIGGGSRLKLLEALAAGLPVVSTTLGAMGLPGLVDGLQLRITDDAGAFAAAVITLLAQPELAGRLGRCGREFVVREYDWQAIAPSLLQVYEDIGRR